ncbi:MFS transporter [Nocardioides sp. YIM 152588]|uniref:MFS transporter n=1 Tax=Nocardioides sp. YIM 152588 TaxID=3158259 RepID=UPI0032E529F9
MARAGPDAPGGRAAAPRGRTPWTPWRTVLAFGFVSLAADMVYEGMRSVAGPYLGSLGASALTVGIVTGAGEAVALVLRLVTGPWADRAQRHWRLTVVGYGLTAVCVPLLALAPALGAAGVAFAAALILAERTGKAVRSPAKSALLARVAVRTGRGKAFGVHKALDQVGAFAGPLLLAGTTAATGLIWPGLALLAVPGAVSLLLLALLRRRVPSVAEPDPDAAASSPPAGLLRPALGADLPGSFHRFSAAAALTTFGLMTFGVISFQFVRAGVFPTAAAPLVYAVAMAVGAVAALATGALFDRWSGGVLLVVPVLAAAVPWLVFDDRAAVVLAGVVVWGAATGVQDSAVKAFVADLVPAARRATAFGIFAAVQGLGALAGGAVAGALVTHHADALGGIVVAAQALAAYLMVTTLRRPGGVPSGH